MIRALNADNVLVPNFECIAGVHSTSQKDRVNRADRIEKISVGCQPVIT